VDGDGFDPARVTPTVMERISGIARAQWARWAEAGLSRNPDGSFDLRIVFSWIRKNPQRAGARRYRQKPSAVVKRLQEKINQVVEQELKGQHDED
jgi:hypothetical protein